MPDTEYVKRCYNQLLRSSRNEKEEEKYNWCIRVKNIFYKCGFGRVWDMQNLSELLIGKEKILNKWHELLKCEDMRAIAKSSSCKLYAKMEVWKGIEIFIFKMVLGTC